MAGASIARVACRRLWYIGNITEPNYSQEGREGGKAAARECNESRRLAPSATSSLMPSLEDRRVAIIETKLNPTTEGPIGKA